jgi:methylmalonyl-CoA mutase
MKKQTDQKGNLFSSFPVLSMEEWASVAKSETGGGDPLDKLLWKPEDGLEFLPLYTGSDVKKASPPFHLASDFSARHWSNMPLVKVTDEQSANEVALDHLSHEAEGILFELSSPETNFAQLLENIAWENCTVSFIASAGSSYSDLSQLVTSHTLSAQRINGALFSRAGQTPQERYHASYRTHGIIIDSSSAVQEVAEALQKGAAIMDKAIESGHDAEIVQAKIAFMMPIGARLFLETAKFRALRMLWYQVVRAFGVNNFKLNDPYIHGYSAPWINAKFQPHGNMLKSTIAAIAGIGGGCNAVTIVPEDPENTTMNRIARNISRILLDESHLNKVNDPFAGAYAIEAMTDEIAKKAWGQFQSSITV